MNSPAPQLRQALHQTLSVGPDHGAVLALAQTRDLLIAGTQRGDILAWSRTTFRRTHAALGAHAAGCLSLALDTAHHVLFSGGGDGRVRAWDARSLAPLYTVHGGENAGGVLALAYFGDQDALALGCQNASVQWFDVGRRRAMVGGELAERRSRFFDARADSGSASPEPGAPAYVVDERCVAAYAHSGYVYCALAGRLADGRAALFTAGGDGAVRVWRVSDDGQPPQPLHVLARPAGAGAGASASDSGSDDDDDSCVHALALGADGLLFAGLQSGAVCVWDLETMQCIRTLAPAAGAAPSVFALLAAGGLLYAGGADGRVRVWTAADLQPAGHLAAADDDAAARGPVLALAGGGGTGGEVVVGGGGDIGVWAGGWRDAHVPQPQPDAPAPAADAGPQDMLRTLGRWVRLRSVAGVPELQPECRRAALFLRDLLQQHGAADARLLAGAPGANPLVYARFDATAGGAAFAADTPTVLVYGHYDVMPAGDAALWAAPAFDMRGRDGHVYGRGVSDDKGPVLAMALAVADLHVRGRLALPVVFCIEGEEERGSLGLQAAVAAHRALFGAPRVVLLSSAYWLGERTPCLTYGMRGAIRATVRVAAPARAADVHAGVWGGAVSEPLACLAHVLARLATPGGRVLVPGFYDAVRAVGAAETRAMRRLVRWITAKEADAPLVARAAAASPQPERRAATRARLHAQLMRRWRHPTLTVHHVDVSTGAAPSNATLVPAAAQASLSVRVVPDQSLDAIAAGLRAHIEHVFAECCAGGVDDSLRLELDVQPVAQWWLADPAAPVYRLAARAIREAWALGGEPLESESEPESEPASDNESGDESEPESAAADFASTPLLIREGGSIPAVPWLEAFFAPHAVAVNLPMGQSSDNAHMANERISIENLIRGRDVVYRLLDGIGDVVDTTQGPAP
ncbi:hypothetical protein GGI15_001880 [Coemansia interrupta]|uniref:Peptidase M20 dimerisation domain-containing protein n=1 Tax=Coemansia interrupta TaxID=1126814 RepID=A0A9W8HG39_9FUNG|nr:hypothetical protein GGI15_001880 [Coemansia interrupta]